MTYGESKHQNPGALLLQLNLNTQIDFNRELINTTIIFQQVHSFSANHTDDWILTALPAPL